MALVALTSVATPVFVVFLVTGKTGDALGVVMEVAAMASVATDCPVFADQWKIRALVVIESGLRPFSRGVAVAAAIAIASGMNIVEAMTSDTGCRCVFIALVYVTLFAGCVAMFPAQRE